MTHGTLDPKYRIPCPKKAERADVKSMNREDVKKEFFDFSSELIKTAKVMIAKEDKSLLGQFIITSAINVGTFICGLNCCPDSPENYERSGVQKR